MFALKLFNNLKGYIVVEVLGNNTEKLLNIAITRKIHIWDVKRRKNSIVLKIGIKGYKEIVAGL